MALEVWKGSSELTRAAKRNKRKGAGGERQERAEGRAT